jgi:hypothetical protein
LGPENSDDVESHQKRARLVMGNQGRPELCWRHTALTMFLKHCFTRIETEELKRCSPETGCRPESPIPLLEELLGVARYGLENDGQNSGNYLKLLLR